MVMLSSAGKILKRLAVILAVLACVVIIVLKIIERSPGQLQVGFESYLTQAVGYPADIGTLHRVTFFPDFSLDMEDVRFWPIDNPDGRVISAARVAVRTPFWSLMIGRPRFEELRVDNAMIDKAVTGSVTVDISAIALNEAKDAIDYAGRIGDLRIEGAIPLGQPHPRISGTIEGARSKGFYFIDLEDNGYGATVTFETYRPADLRPLERLIEGRLAGRPDQTFPVSLHIERLDGRPGPFIAPDIRLESGELQPLSCFDKNQGAAPCAGYLKADQ